MLTELQQKRHNLAVLTHVTTFLLPPFSFLINVYDEIQLLTSFSQLELLKELHTCFLITPNTSLTLGQSGFHHGFVPAPLQGSA